MIMRSMMAAATLTGLVAGTTSAESVFTADLQTLNANYGSNATGTATLTLTGEDTLNPSLRVQISATGLPDVSGIPGATHVAHIHGQFLENQGVPVGQQTSGPFFSGTGGTPVDSVTPTQQGDQNNIFANDFVNFFEGLPKYGPVVLNLSALQVPAAPDGVPPLIQGINVAQADNGIGLLDAFPNNGETFELDTTYTFDLTDPDSARQYNNLTPLEFREIVLHGIVVPADINQPIDELAASLGLNPALLGVDLGDGNFFRTTGPVAAGGIVAVADPNVVPSPTAAAAGVLLLSYLAARRRNGDAA